MRRILLLGIALSLAACGGNDAVSPPATPTPVTPTPVTIAGPYQLATVDGQSLPVLLSDFGAYQVWLVSAGLELNANGTFSLEFNYRLDDSGNMRPATNSNVGVWTSTRDSIVLTNTAANVATTGTVSGNVVTIPVSGKVLVLRK